MGIFRAARPTPSVFEVVVILDNRKIHDQTYNYSSEGPSMKELTDFLAHAKRHGMTCSGPPVSTELVLDRRKVQKIEWSVERWGQKSALTIYVARVGPHRSPKLSTLVSPPLALPRGH